MATNVAIYKFSHQVVSGTRSPFLRLLNFEWVIGHDEVGRSPKVVLTSEKP